MVGLDPDSLSEWYSKGLEDLRYRYKMQPGDVIIDAGAYEGSWAQRIANENPGIRVVCFEPTDAINGCTWATVNKAALWVYDGQIELGGDKFATSIDGDNKRLYDCVDIEKVVEPFDVVKVLKINCELAEYELVKHLIKTGMINRIENLQVQFHITDSFDYETAYKQLAGELSKTHDITWRYPFCWENWKLKEK